MQYILRKHISAQYVIEHFHKLIDSFTHFQHCTHANKNKTLFMNKSLLGHVYGPVGGETMTFVLKQDSLLNICIETE